MKFAFEKSSGPVKSTIKWWDEGPYCHVECIFSENADGTYDIASSKAFQGVRVLKNQILDPSNWEIIDCPSADLISAKEWFQKHNGEHYYYGGIFGFVFRPLADGSRTKWFCSDACCAASLGIAESWRISPNCLANIVNGLDAINLKKSLRN